MTYYCIICIKYLGNSPHYYILPAANYMGGIWERIHFRGKGARKIWGRGGNGAMRGNCVIAVSGNWTSIYLPRAFL